MRFLIVGTGRSGTTYCVEALNALGLKFSHQQTFTFERLNNWDGITPYWKDSSLDGEASFMAVPYLHQIKVVDPNLKIIHVSRDLTSVVTSWLQRGAFGAQFQEIYPDFAAHCSKMVTEGTPRNISHYARESMRLWHNKAASHADVLIELEHAYPAQLAQLVDAWDLFTDSDGNKTKAARTMEIVPTDLNSGWK